MVTNMPTIRAKLIASLSEGHELSGSPDLLITLYMISLYSICDLLSNDLVPQVGLELYWDINYIVTGTVLQYLHKGTSMSCYLVLHYTKLWCG